MESEVGALVFSKSANLSEYSPSTIGRRMQQVLGNLRHLISELVAAIGWSAYTLKS